MENKIQILLVEDNLADIRLTKEAFRECQIENEIHEVHTGVEAIKFLNKEGEYQNKPRPALILLDLNLPQMHGHEVLDRIKRDENLKRIPVVILTTSQSEEDILKSYNSHANCYIQKPVGFDQFIEAVKSIEEFWLKIGKIPD